MHIVSSESFPTTRGRARSAPTLLPGRLRAAIPFDQFDYQTLMHFLHEYSAPRDKVTDLLDKGIIERVRKGLYVFGTPYRHEAISREVLANLIYGPSCISLDYALQHYGLIPEAVESLTSVTTGRSRLFRTPFGSFSYRMISLRAFRVGVDLIQPEGGSPYLMATPEKALADKLVAEKGLGIRGISGLKGYLVNHLRVPAVELGRLDQARLHRIAAHYRSRLISLLVEVVRDEQRRTGGKT